MLPTSKRVHGLIRDMPWSTLGYVQINVLYLLIAKKFFIIIKKGTN